MKKLLILSALMLFLSGCGSNNTDDNIFSVSANAKAEYLTAISDCLKPYNHRYNPDAINFNSVSLPAKTDNFFAAMETVTSDGGIALKPHAGKSVVEAAVELEHINGDNTGTAHFYFDGNKLLGGYYVYKNSYYSLSTINPFEDKSVFNQFENTAASRQFEKTELKKSLGNVLAVQKGIIAGVQEDNTIFYFNSQDDFRVLSKADYTGYGRVPLDITLGDDFGAILLGEPVKVQQNEDENEVSDTVAEPPAKSVAVVMTDGKGKPVGSAIATSVGSYTSIAQSGDRLFLARDKSIDEFIYKNNKPEKISTYVLDHYISSMRIADLDGNSTPEFILSDGGSIYIYEKTSTFNPVWRSSSYLSSIDGIITSGDLNGDGIKELYVTDSIGITARYILTNQGFKISGGGIVSGTAQRYVVADFNGDGKDDYMIVPEEEKPSLYLSK